MNWYTVKLLYKMTITGAPDSELVDEFFSDRTEFFEESIILVNAASSEDAYKIAENTIPSEVYINKYGQTVTKEFLDSIDCFELYEQPQALTEIYSTVFCNCNNEGSDINSVIDTRYDSCSAEELHMLRYR